MRLKEIELKRTGKNYKGEEQTWTSAAEYNEKTNAFIETFTHFKVRVEQDLWIGNVKEWETVEWKEKEEEKWKPFLFLMEDSNHPLYSKMIEASKNKDKIISWKYFNF